MRLAVSLLLLALSAAASAAESLPWLALDIDRIGAQRLQALKDDPRVRHWSELGNRLLVRADPAFTAEMQASGRVLGRLDDAAALVAEPLTHCSGGEAGHAEHPVDLFGARGGGWAVRHDSGAKSATGVALQHRAVVSWQLANRASKRAAADPRLLAFAAAVDGMRWKAANAALASHNRQSGPGFSAAAEWLAGEFRALGLQVELASFIANPQLAAGGRNRNVLALQPGSGDGLVIVGAHLDSRNGDYNDLWPAPGAEDNASGCAGVLEAARVLSAQSFDADIVYVCYGLEERGLFGSDAHARSLADPLKVRGMINMDMIAFDGDDRLDLNIEAVPHAAPLLELLATNAETYTELEPVISSSTCCSDHVSYLDRGMPAALLIQGDFSQYQHYHTSTDFPERLSATMARETVKLAVVTAAALAAAPVRTDLDGYWFDPAQSGHGFHVEAQHDGTLLATWYTFDAAGRQLWLVASGALEGGSAVLQAHRTEGGAFPPAFDPQALSTHAWGTLWIDFSDCAHASVRWEALDADAFAPGSMPLQRLSRPAAGSCD